MENQAHSVIAQFFMDNSQLQLENYCLNADTGHLSCDFVAGEDVNAVKVNLRYIPGKGEGESWIALRGVIGQMGEIYNLSRIADFFNDFPIPLYSLMQERRGRILILGRSREIKELDYDVMNSLINDLEKMIRTIRQFMLPVNCHQRSLLTT